MIKDFRTFIAHAILYLFRLLPKGGQKFIFMESAPDLNIRSFQYIGPLGIFSGSPKDKTVFNTYFLQNEWETEIRSKIQSLLIDGGTYIDIGSNIGLILIPIAKNKNVLCYGFEPEPENFELLKKNAYDNGVFENIKLFNFALYNKECSLEMEKSTDNYGDHRIKRTKEDIPYLYAENVRKTVPVKAVTLDSVFKEEKLKRPVIVKMDVQGAEVAVLQGARNFISKIDYLISEFWPYGLVRQNNTPEEFVELTKCFPYGKIIEGGRIGDIFDPIESVVEKMRRISGPDYYPIHLNIVYSRSIN